MRTLTREQAQAEYQRWLGMLQQGMPEAQWDFDTWARNFIGIITIKP